MKLEKIYKSGKKKCENYVKQNTLSLYLYNSIDFDFT